VEDEHEAPNGEFCVRCGVSILDVNSPGDDDENRLRIYGGWAALIVGGISLCVSNVIRPPVIHKGDPASASGGVQVAYTAARYGSYLLALGVILLLITPAIRRRR
jgi:hypothetical protein